MPCSSDVDGNPSRIEERCDDIFADVCEFSARHGMAWRGVVSGIELFRPRRKLEASKHDRPREQIGMTPAKRMIYTDILVSEPVTVDNFYFLRRCIVLFAQILHHREMTHRVDRSCGKKIGSMHHHYYYDSWGKAASKLAFKVQRRSAKITGRAGFW
ncbi:uncharacterized protein MYCFIDRAFT_173683 [Pseudocercospora fijiensis CIRAD86]|uniref:Uncharacterized protein n=1 Tax=Pseudocercospora fijiensis (strain CIRAD86) TaxID=383855 RepID=M3B602_PSEFD|nr:uncharacterized protein MYCFIDRAFT_173683 [Pseudocercospora fijiensis CIRAD86]EME84753.1 hypothetical protein MYCFIDRAFT_173683 [Pseudocercospora fijiensis CIRAD86]